MQNHAVEILAEGVKLLQPLFAKHGFVYAPMQQGASSGGQFAYGEFRRDNRRFESHFRHSLGMVTYHLGSESITHQEYMLSVLGKPNASRYPRFSDDPMDGFRRLAQDIEEHGAEFLEGTDDAFLHRIKDARARWVTRAKLPD